MRRVAFLVLALLPTVTITKLRSPVPPSTCGQAQVTWIGITYDETTNTFVITRQVEPITDWAAARDRTKEVATQGTFGVVDYVGEYFPPTHILKASFLRFGC